MASDGVGQSHDAPDSAAASSSSRYFATVTDEPLDLNVYAQLVADPSAGAISTFSGVTRNNWRGKAVIRLEYEAYVPMATKKLKEICELIMAKWEICKVAIGHRTGVVEVGARVWHIGTQQALAAA